MGIRVDGHTIISKLVIEYLGVMIDVTTNLKRHLNYAGEKAANTSVSLERIRPHIGIGVR